MLASSTWLLHIMVTGVMLIGWGNRVILVHVTWTPNEIRQGTEGLWNKLYFVTTFFILDKKKTEQNQMELIENKVLSFDSCNILNCIELSVDW